MSDKQRWMNDFGQIMLLLAGVAGLLFIMFLLQHLINPMGYGIIVAVVLYPVRNHPVGKALLFATLYLTGFWLIYDSGHLLIPFVIAFILAFLANPFVNYLEAFRIPRTLIAAVFSIIGFILVGAFLFYAIPSILLQLRTLLNVVNEASKNTDGWLGTLGLTPLFTDLGLEPTQILPILSHQINVLTNAFFEQLTTFSGTTLSGVTSIVGILFFVILMPFLLFFMIRDYSNIGKFVRTLFFPKHISEDYVTQIGTIVGSYLRGQFIVVVISAFNLSVGFYLFGVPYAFLLGILSGLTNFIPTFGLWLSIISCSIVAISTGTPWYQYLPGIYIVFGIEQVLETGYIVPRVVGKHVGLHPLLIMLSLLIFGFMFGFLGLVTAVPTVALLSIFYKQYRETNRISFLQSTELDLFLEQFEKKQT